MHVILVWICLGAGIISETMMILSFNVGRCKFQICMQRAFITLPQCVLLKLKKKTCDSHSCLLSTSKGEEHY
jgi:hypothetical protein